MTTALFIGRFAPSHKGHIDVVMQLLDSYDRVVIGIGSCYEIGSSRYPLLAIFREKMLLLSIAERGGDLSRIKVVYLEDYPNFDEWLKDVLEICKKYNVTHFITGNREEILDVLLERKIHLPFQFINPELTSNFSHHATELRNAIKNGDFQKVKHIASYGTLMLMGNVDGLNGIRMAVENSGRVFNVGRQTVDLIFTIQEKEISPSNEAYYKTYVLCGYRPKDKEDYPNYLGLVGDMINKFESPIDAVLRALKQRTGIEAKVEMNTTEPTIITLKSDNGPILADLKFLEFYTDKEQSGKRGGSSQAFHININGDRKMFDNILKNGRFGFMSAYEALKIGLAYQQTEMLQDALNKLKHYA